MVLGDGESVASVFQEVEERVGHQVPSERRVQEAMKLVEAVGGNGDVISEELNSGSRRGAITRVRSLLAGRLVTKVGIPQADAARLLGVTIPAIARALTRAGSN